MNKNDKKSVKEIIEFILARRKMQFFHDKISDSSFYYGEESDEETKKIIIEGKQNRTLKEFDIPLIKLNNLLKKEDKYQEVLDIEQHMKKIQAKKYITVIEFESIYDTGSTSQQTYRERRIDPLPYHQKVPGGKITYNVKEVERWLQNQYK